MGKMEPAQRDALNEMIPRDLAAEIDELRARIAQLEGI